MATEKKLLCIGHRGAMGHAPENTLLSIRKALELGTPATEVDVYFVDGHLIVFHDDRLERTTNGVGYLSEQSFNYLRSLNAGGGQRIPTLLEVCEVIDSQACLNIELKGPSTAAPVAELISNLVDSGWDKDTFLVSSFNHRELLAMKQLNHDIKLGVLISGNLDEDFKFAEDLGAFSVHSSFDFTDQQFIDVVHDMGLKVYVYTVNHQKDMAKMHKLGVDGVFTNFPERVLEIYSQGDRTKAFTRRQEVRWR